MPLASRLGEKTTVLPAADVDAVVSRVMSEHRGGCVLIVGHSNTLPEIIQKLSGISIPEIGDDEYDNVYIVTVPTIGTSSVLRLKY
jgi:broad specificity phosphatase PhoE